MPSNLNPVQVRGTRKTMEERVCETDGFRVWSKRPREWQMVRAKMATAKLIAKSRSLNAEITGHLSNPVSTRHSLQPGPKKTPFLCPQGRVVHAGGRVDLSWWTNVNTVISAVFVNFRTFMSVSQSYTCRLQQLQTSACMQRIAGCFQLSK